MTSRAIGAARCCRSCVLDQNGHHDLRIVGRANAANQECGSASPLGCPVLPATWTPSMAAEVPSRVDHFDHEVAHLGGRLAVERPQPHLSLVSWSMFLW